MTILDRATLITTVQPVFPFARVEAPWDLRYAQILHDHIAEVFGAEFSTELFLLRGTTRWAMAYDCDKFADFARSLLKLKHGIAQGFSPDTPEGVTCGMLAYAIGGDRQRGHCINVIVTERGVECWEPQTQQFVTLSEAERHSAWLVQF